MNTQNQRADSAELLGSEGPFNQLPGFFPRAGQQHMASLVDAAIATSGHAVIEAPSGSGKTLAYLVPIVAGQVTTIISTASHYLQNQLFRRDLPLVQNVLGITRQIALLKGRSNYLCPYYLNQSLASAQLSTSVRSLLLMIAQWYRTAPAGDLSASGFDITAAVRPMLTSSAADCLGQSCPYLADCPLMKARQQAANADIVIVNHSLLFADRVAGDYQGLPEADLVVVDEAHRLADFGQTVIGDWLTHRQLLNFIEDARAAIKQYAADQGQVVRFLEQLHQSLSGLFDNVPDTAPYHPQQHAAIPAQIRQSMCRLMDWFAVHADRAQTLKELKVRLQLLTDKLAAIENGDGLCWVEARNKTVVMQNMPTSLSIPMRKIFADAQGSWVFTSATLSVAGSAEQFLTITGLQQAAFHNIDSDIDYQRNARLYTPLLAVEPEHEDYSEAFINAAKPLLDAVNGRALLLFSSHRALQQAVRLLQQQGNYALYVQGQCEHFQLIERFSRADKAVLMGTGSFWEGLDLSGARLSCVIIDKLPFVSPTDPLVKLRSQYLSRHGVDSFNQYLLPEAVIRLRQGCGRLLRRLQDKGVIMIADPRLQSRQYGQLFIDSLPAMQQLFTLEPVLEFLRDLNTDETTGD